MRARAHEDSRGQISPLLDGSLAGVVGCQYPQRSQDSSKVGREAGDGIEKRASRVLSLV